MPAKIYKATLTDEERGYLTALISKCKAAERKLTRARVLLKADQSEDGPAWDDRHISESFDVSAAKVERVRRCFAEDGTEAALSHKKTVRNPSCEI